MSGENCSQQPSADQAAAAAADAGVTPVKTRRSILNDYTFLVDIADKIICSKVERLVHSYGGKIIQTLEKNISYLISDSNNDKISNSKTSESSNCNEDVEVKNVVPCSKNKTSIDLINKANLLSIDILSPKQFQQWLKSMLKKKRVNKSPIDKVASVLRGKVSLKIESMDQGQCPIFEFIPKWPDLGDTLCKKKTKIPTQRKCIEDKSGDEYSSDQYSTSEIGGMCELCDMPFMNYKEHINTKKHLRESQDDNRFHELDELINERPLSVIFNQFVPDKTINEQNLVLEKPSDKSCMEDTIVVIDSDSDDEQNVPCLFGEKIHILEEQTSPNLKRKFCSDSNISFVPQKKPKNCSFSSPPSTENVRFEKTKRKHKTRKKRSSKDIYKVEVVNSLPLYSKDSSHNDRIESDKPPVIIRLKRVINSLNKPVSNKHSTKKSPYNNDVETSEDPIPAQRYIRVVRKLSNSEMDGVLSKGFSTDLTFMFEQPELRYNTPKSISYYPTYSYVPNTGSSMQFIQERITKIDDHGSNCTLSNSEFLDVMSNIEPRQIGDWFYKVPKKIKDDLSFDSTVLVPLPQSSNKSFYGISEENVNSYTSSSSVTML